MINFKLNKVSVALISSGLLAMSSSAIAQTEQNNNQKVEEKQVEVIQVTGIRGSLIKAQAIKMSSNSIVEVISAEDIGKLPDTSIAESLARLPGVTGERRNGRTSGLSVRGFNENYIGTSLNGRELLGMGDNRGVEFDLYPTEIISTLAVHKSSQADLLVQGVGGTVNLETISPLSAAPAMAFNLQLEQNEKDSLNPDYDNQGHKLSFNFVDKFADDTLGVALVIASQETPRQEEFFSAWGYSPLSSIARTDEDIAGDTVASQGTDVIINGGQYYGRSAMLERDSIAAVIEYQPNDQLNITFDALYIDFEENDVRRGIIEGRSNNFSVTGVENGLVTSGFQDGFNAVIRNDSTQQKAELTAFGLNLDYEINDTWSATLDLSTSSVDKDIVGMEAYAGTGRAGSGAASARSFEMVSTGAIFSDHPTIAPVDLTNPDILTLAGPQSWGGGFNALASLPQFAGGSPSDAQDGFINRPKFEEELNSIRIDVEGLIEFSIFNSIKAGVNFSERTKQKTNQGAFLTAPTFPGDGPIPDVTGFTDLSFVGIKGVVAFDGPGLVNSGYYTETDAALVENTRLGDSYTISEDLLTFYTKLDIETEIGDILVSGNLGVQVVNADQEGSGYNTSSGADGLTRAIAVSDDASYTDVLPSFNLNFEIAENQFIRTAASKVISRPRIDTLRPNSAVSFQFNDVNILQTDPTQSAWSASSGSTQLKPLEANQYDISYENYFADNGYFAVSFFYKDLKNWHRNSPVTTDFSDFYIPGFHQTTDGQVPGTLSGQTTSAVDGFTGYARGYELQASVPLELVHENLEGFGVTMSATFIDGELSDDSPVPGLSEESYSLTAYYERNGFEIRLSGTKRDEFITETRGLSLSLIPRTDQGSEIWDMQMGYDFSESGIESLDGLRITLQAQNLTNEDSVQADGSGFLSAYSSFGANYMLGLNYKF
jgi:iron complex outermembrane receptor protein